MGKDSTCQDLIDCIGFIGLTFFFSALPGMVLMSVQDRIPLPQPPGMVGSGSGGYDETQAYFIMILIMFLLILSLGIGIICICKSLDEAEKNELPFLRGCAAILIVWFVFALSTSIFVLKSTDAWDLPMADYVVILILIVCGVSLCVGYNCLKNKPGHRQSGPRMQMIPTYTR